MSRQFITALLLGSALMSGACATTAKGAKSSALAGDYAAQTYRSQAPLGTTLAVVRYPAFVDPDARDLYQEAFKNSPIDGSISRKSGMESEALADSVILKSNYFALSLFKELAAKLPEHSVLLSPHIITPLVSVKTDPRAAAPTQGVLLASTPLMKRAAGNGKDSSEAVRDALQTGRLTARQSDLDFIAHLNKDTSVNIAQKPLSDRSNSAAARFYPVTGNAAAIDPAAKAFSKPMANRIVGLINRTDADKAAMVGRAAAIAQFDESLAALNGTGRTGRYRDRRCDCQFRRLRRIRLQKCPLTAGVQ